MAKVFAADTAAEVSLEAMKIFGGNGYSKDFAIERYYRDAPLTLIGGGTGEVLRLDDRATVTREVSRPSQPDRLFAA